MFAAQVLIVLEALTLLLVLVRVDHMTNNNAVKRKEVTKQWLEPFGNFADIRPEFDQDLENLNKRDQEAENHGESMYLNPADIFPKQKSVGADFNDSIDLHKRASNFTRTSSFEKNGTNSGNDVRRSDFDGNKVTNIFYLKVSQINE